LLQRYTRQLDEQETRLETLQQEIAAATAARDKANEELSRIIGSTSFEITAG
jgi:outer membrane protein TolC